MNGWVTALMRAAVTLPAAIRAQVRRLERLSGDGRRIDARRRAAIAALLAAAVPLTAPAQAVTLESLRRAEAAIRTEIAWLDGQIERLLQDRDRATRQNLPVMIGTIDTRLRETRARRTQRQKQLVEVLRGIGRLQ